MKTEFKPTLLRLKLTLCYKLFVDVTQMYYRPELGKYFYTTRLSDINLLSLSDMNLLTYHDNSNISISIVFIFTQLNVKSNSISNNSV